MVLTGAEAVVENGGIINRVLKKNPKIYFYLLIFENKLRSVHILQHCVRNH